MFLKPGADVPPIAAKGKMLGVGTGYISSMGLNPFLNTGVGPGATCLGRVAYLLSIRALEPLR